MLISERRTLTNWGSSSSDSFRSHLPTRVMRGSSAILNTGPVFSLSSLSSASLSSASTHMLRNFNIRKVLPSLPTRSWLKNTGPFGSSTLIRIAIMANSQQNATSTAALKTISNTRLTKRYATLSSMPVTGTLPSSSLRRLARSELSAEPPPPLKSYAKPLRTVLRSKALLFPVARLASPDGESRMSDLACPDSQTAVKLPVTMRAPP